MELVPEPEQNPEPRHYLRSEGLQYEVPKVPEVPLLQRWGIHTPARIAIANGPIAPSNSGNELPPQSEWIEPPPHNTPVL